MEAFLALLFGLLIGSFLNVCISRWPNDLSVVRPRSHCMKCGQMIVWYDNVPLLSYALLRGRCRHCRERISLRYPVVELLTGLLFFASIRLAGANAAGLKLCVFTAILAGLIFSDLEERILPDELTLGGALIGFAFAFFVPTPDFTAQFALSIAGLELEGVKASLVESAAGGLMPALTLWGGGWLYQKLRGREGLGFGDVKLILMVGTFTGLRGALLTVFLGSFAGSVIGYAYMRLAGKDPSTYELPFGTFLGAAGIVLGLFSAVYPL
jgi:leader peptidase (prepilin peptidase) / N-methyltransferase